MPSGSTGSGREGLLVYTCGVGVVILGFLRIVRGGYWAALFLLVTIENEAPGASAGIAGSI
jgi:hypothetical protein